MSKNAKLIKNKNVKPNTKMYVLTNKNKNAKHHIKMNVLQKRNKYVKPHIPRSANQLTIMKRNVRKSLMKVVTMLKFHTVRKCHKNTVLTTLCLNVIRNPNKNATIILYPNV